MSLSIQKLNFTQTDSIQTAANTAKTKEAASIFSTDKTEKTTDTKKEKEIKNKSNQIINKVGNTKKLLNVKNIIHRLIEKNEHAGIFQIASSLKNKADDIGDAQLELLARAVSLQNGNVSESEIESFISELTEKADAMVRQIDVLNNNAIQTRNLNQAVIKFKAKGGDPDKINWDMLNQKMMENLDAIGKEAETKGEGTDDSNTTKTTAQNGVTSDLNNNSTDIDANIKEFDKKMDELIKYLSDGGKEKPQNNEFINDDTNEEQTMQNPFLQQDQDKNNKFKFGLLNSNNI